MRLRGYVVLILIGLASSLQAADRPNFLWILSEDNSKTLSETVR